MRSATRAMTQRYAAVPTLATLSILGSSPSPSPSPYNLQFAARIFARNGLLWTPEQSLCALQKQENKGEWRGDKPTPVLSPIHFRDRNARTTLLHTPSAIYRHRHVDSVREPIGPALGTATKQTSSSVTRAKL